MMIMLQISLLIYALMAVLNLGFHFEVYLEN
jgi:hypothetical protein